MGLRTIVLKLHKPGKEKLRILEEALLNYNRAWNYLLARAAQELEDIRSVYGGQKGSYRSAILSKWVSKELSDELNRFQVQPFKDSLRLELGMALASYLSLETIQEGAAFPKPSDTDSADGLVHLRPLYFCRYDVKRSYSLLYDKEKDRYYAKLYLLNGTKARPAAGIGSRSGGKLEYIYREPARLEAAGKKEAFLLLPLSFGKFQEEFLKQAREKPEMLRTAKLSRKRGEYFLSVSIETDNAPGIEPAAYLGVARGLRSSLNYTVVDGKGLVLHSGAILPRVCGPEQGRIPSGELHKAANAIVSLARENRAQVILQNLNDMGDGISRSILPGSVRQPAFRCRSYIRLAELLEYKLPELGLPAPVKVSPADIFYRCPGCGHGSRRNRQAGEMFICTECGTTMELENLGSLNLARKLIRYDRSGIRIKVAKTLEGNRFTCGLIGLDCVLPHSAGQLLQLQEILRQLIDGLREAGSQGGRDRDSLKRASLLKKLDSREDLMDFIEFV